MRRIIYTDELKLGEPARRWLAAMAAWIFVCPLTIRRTDPAEIMAHANIYGEPARRGPLARLFQERQIYIRAGERVTRLTLRPAALALIYCAIAVLVAWLATSTAYVVLRDRVKTGKAHYLSMQKSSLEERFAALQSNVDALNSRNVLDRRIWRKEVAALTQLQSELEQRHNDVLSLIEREGDAKTSSRESAGGGISNAVALVHSGSGDRIHLVFEPRGTPPRQAHPNYRYSSLPRPLRGEDLSGLEATRLYARIGRLATGQIDQLHAIRTANKREAGKLRAVIYGLGLPPDAIAASAAGSNKAMGGPPPPSLAGIRRPSASGPFAIEMKAAASSLRNAAHMSGAFKALPLGRPVAGALTTTSDFGLRRDPFKGTFATHYGMDFRGPVGKPVRTTGSGRVARAEYTSGYGRLVVINHDNGITTRYAHMSRIEVSKGQKVAAGDRIGRLGNSGRSTGPHLHYETRLNGRAVDPARFLKVGDHVFEKTGDRGSGNR